MDDEQDSGMELESLEIPAYPFVQSAAIADVLELAASQSESVAELMRAFAERMKADHNHKVDVSEGVQAAAAELERIVKGDETSDG